jgi:hypothetical protein
VLTAPADNLLGARPGGGSWQVAGTSFAAPLVAGTAALIRSRWPAMSAANVVNRLISTADGLGLGSNQYGYGYGEVDAEQALTAEVPAVSHNPLLTANSPAAPRPAAAAMPAPTQALVTTPRLLGLASGILGLAVALSVVLLVLLRRRPNVPAGVSRPTSDR